MRTFGDGEDISTEIGDVVIVGGQSAGPPINVHGTKPPAVPSTWWPWIIAAGIAGGLWWLTRSERRRPLGRAAG